MPRYHNCRRNCGATPVDKRVLPYFCSCSPLQPDSAILPWMSEGSTTSLDSYGCAQEHHLQNHCKVAKLETLQLNKFITLKKAVSAPEGFKTSHVKSTVHDIPYKFSHEENSSAALREYRLSYTYPNMRRALSTDPSTYTSSGKETHTSALNGTVKPKLMVLGKCVGQGGNQLREKQPHLRYSAPFRKSKLSSRPLEYELSFRMRWVSHSIPSWLLPPGSGGSTPSLSGTLPIPRSIAPKWDRSAYAVNVSAYQFTSRSPQVAAGQPLQFHHLAGPGRTVARTVQTPSKHYFNTSTKTGIITSETRRKVRRSNIINGVVVINSPWSEKTQLTNRGEIKASFTRTDREIKKQDDEE